MNSTIIKFVNFLMTTIKRSSEGTPNYLKDMPASSPPITYHTYSFSSQKWQKGEDGKVKLALAQRLVSEGDRAFRAQLALAGFSTQLNILFEYLQNNTLTFEEKTYLLINLDAYFKEMPVKSYANYTYTIAYFTEYNDGSWETNYKKRSIQCPVGDTCVNLELNALKFLALEQISQFNSKQINQQLPPPAPQLPFIHTGLKTFMPAKANIAPILMQPTLFDFLINLMLTVNNELTHYEGLARLKSNSLFIESLNNNTKKWLELSESPKNLQNTVVYKMIATPRAPSILTFFTRTRTQNIFERMITEENKKRTQGTASFPSAPPQPEASAIATPVDNYYYRKL